jgi:glutamate 5-kinase
MAARDTGSAGSSATGSTVADDAQSANERARQVRERIATARRLVVKVGSSSLTSRSGGLDADRLAALADALLGRRSAGAQVVVVSSGAIASGLAPLGLKRPPTDLATAQAAASVGQGLLLAQWATALGRGGAIVGQVLLTADDVVRRSHYRNAQRTLERLLEMGVVPVVNENDTVATEEIRFGDNDRLAALVAHLVRADALVLLSDVEALHTAPPGTPGAETISVVTDARHIEGVVIGGTGDAGVGRGGMQTKVEAARIATSAGIPAVLASAHRASEVLSGGEIGTVFLPTGSPLRARLLWLAHASEPRGRIHIDAGAVEAVVGRRLSLLPAGVTSVDGDFVSGDAVDIISPDGRAVARGIVTYDASEIPSLAGKSTRELVAEKGPAYEREIIHRDDLVLLEAIPSPTLPS